MKETNTKKRFNIPSITIIVVFGLLVLFMVINLVSQRNHNLTYLFNYSYAVVPTESMDPTIKVDDMVLIKKGNYEDIHVDPIDGDIIVYYSEEYNIFIIHRAVGYFDDGTIICRGDNNPSSDTVHVDKNLYRGTAVKWGECLGLGKLVNNGRNIVFLIIIFCLCFFLVTEIIDIIKSIIEKDKKKQEEQENIIDIEAEKEKIRQEILKELSEKSNNK